ncbi:serine/threonine protein kinase [Gigaspora margarita]|uniref:Serine/threonine protein kinase n=1 Tax=Gigaspora margarita TaxID=4874 RepID=A0A8H3XJ47_GIGMA|nr:serine/threonine protein kinase [Gigaspora margarita]
MSTNKQHRRESIISLSVSNNWKDLNNIWTRAFLKVTEKLLDQGTFIEMKDKVIEEHSQHAKEFKKYWRSIIDEQVNTVLKYLTKAYDRSRFAEEERQQQTKKTRKILKGTSLTDAIHHTLTNLIYLQLRRNKSTSSAASVEQRFPSKILKWRFKEKVKIWRSECIDKKYQTPIFNSHTVTCEKNVWVAAEVNIHDNLTPLDRSICFLDGHALEDVIGEPDFIVVDENYEVKRNIEKESLRITKALPLQLNQPNLRVWGVIIVRPNCRYAPYIDKPKMITDEEPSNSGTSDNEQNDDKEFKYKKTIFKGI